MITLRSNQIEPIDKAIKFFRAESVKPSLIVLPTAWGKSILTASIALYYQIVGRGTRIDPDKTDCLVCDLGGNYDRFGRVEDIVFEKGKIWRMFGTGGRLLSGIPIHEIGKYTIEDTRAVDAQATPAMKMPFGKYKDTEIKDIPANYRRWMLDNFQWTDRNQQLRQAILVTMH